MNQELIRQVGVIAEEARKCWEKDSKEGKTGEKAEALACRKMREEGRMVQVRPYPCRTAFPSCSFPCVEVVYVCSGEMRFVAEGEPLSVREGELLFLHAGVQREILPGEEGDVAVQIVILPEFFNETFGDADRDENLILAFLTDCLGENERGVHWLLFRIAGIIPVQNLVENMIWSTFCGHAEEQRISRMTMGLLFLELSRCADRLETAGWPSDQKLLLQVLCYIEENYRDGLLSTLAAAMGFDVYWLSRMIKKITGRNYKDLLQIRRLNEAAGLLRRTRASVAEISAAVGYDNTSYFHRLFRSYFGLSPKEYRMAVNSETISLGSE